MIFSDIGSVPDAPGIFVLCKYALFADSYNINQGPCQIDGQRWHGMCFGQVQTIRSQTQRGHPAKQKIQRRQVHHGKQEKGTKSA